MRTPPPNSLIPKSMKPLARRVLASACLAGVRTGRLGAGIHGRPSPEAAFGTFAHPAADA
eukprot:1909821-Prymnesium_polylepis.1